MTTPLLSVDSATKTFSGLTALNQISFTIEANHIYGLIGPNGAGKSTLFKNIMGLQTLNSGRILFKGEDITQCRVHTIAKKGIVATFQETTLFSDLTVFDNILVACHLESETSLLSVLFNQDREKITKAKDKTHRILDFVKLSDRQQQFAHQLPLGSQRALALAIALAADPELILLDEPFAGMNPEETNQMIELTKKINRSGKTIILVEHDMKAVMQLCQTIIVLNFGQLLCVGSAEKVRNDPQVIQAYLGGAPCN